MNKFFMNNKKKISEIKTLRNFDFFFRATVMI